MFSKFSLICFATMIISCGNAGNRYGDYYWIYSYGYPRSDFYDAAEGISEKWKIRYHSVSGCVIDQKLMDRVNAGNKKTYAAIEEKYGKDWRIQYDREIEEFMMKKVDVMDVLISNTLFRNELRKYGIPIDDVNKEVKEQEDDIYKVVVYNEKLTAENKVCFTVRVNTKDRTVNLIR
ncbi:hypothetical protein ODZ84_03230 [Chryseobacterium fluminis]|uniref:FEKKY domain-containing protein n=1 Tax=Chryseobacterium fluminis TaxID=2983606 RepID=UPI00224CA318|nr:hypothetical protein [Chryseobacterium sp. MMS21-Ot14]UZT98600.1 hypothetical protein ODZ84_03230 [Chryseobacterium sp. MMS21-Ot14]